jgi:2,5-diketo-D-gluconate reductase A
MEKETVNPTKKLATGRAIPRIGFGTYQMRGEECQRAVKLALVAGYTHIDTASIYRN